MEVTEHRIVRVGVVCLYGLTVNRRSWVRVVCLYGLMVNLPGAHHLCQIQLGLGDVEGGYFGLKGNECKV